MTRDRSGNGNDFGSTDSAHRDGTMSMLGYVSLPPTVGLSVSFYPPTLAVEGLTWDLS